MISKYGRDGGPALLSFCSEKICRENIFPQRRGLSSDKQDPSHQTFKQPVFQEHRWQEQLFTWRVWRNNELWVAFGCLVWIIRRLRVEMKYFLTKFVADNKTKRRDVQCWFNYWISIDKYLSEGRFPFQGPHQFTQSWHRVNRKKTWTLHLRSTMWIPHDKKCKCF